MAEDEEPKVKLEVEVPASQLKDAKVIEPMPKKEEKDEPTIAGYKPEDLLSAPVEKPKPVDKRPPNIHQKRVIMLGFIIISAGILFGAALGFVVGISLALAGAFIVVVSVFLRI